MVKFTKEQALVIMGYTGVTTLPFFEFHDEVEKRLGRPIFTHEFADKATFGEIKRAFKADFLDMCK